MREGFAFIEYPYSKEIVKVPGTLEKALKFYDKYKLSHRRLFYDYCDGRELEDDKAFNPWITFNEKRGYKVKKGISVEETAFKEFAWQTIRIKPSDYIKALFYDGDNNESAFECGFLLKEIQASNERVLFANPSPFLIEKDNCSDFLVCDKYFANAYKSEFPNKNFITYEEIDKLSTEYTIFYNVKELDDIQYIISLCEKGSSELVITVPIGIFNKSRAELLSNFKRTGFRISQLLFLDQNIFDFNPKKRIILYISKGKAEDSVPFYFLCRENDSMLILPEKGITSLRYISTANMTYYNMHKSLDDMDELKRKDRNNPEDYYYSREIKLTYTIVNREKDKSLQVSYSSINKNNQNGRRETIRREKRIKELNDNAINQAVCSIVLEEKFSNAIVKDFKDFYKNHFHELSLKTLWFINRSDLQKYINYDDSFFVRLFNDDEFELKDMSNNELMADNIKTSLYYAQLKDKTVEEQMRNIFQLNILFSYLFQERIFIVNPVRDLYKDLSNRMEEEQYEVRNALTKKHFSIEEQIKLLDSTGKRRLWIDSVEYETIVLMFRLLMPVPVAEMLPLTWKDLEYVEDYGFYRINIYKKISRSGEESMYGENDDWKRFRLIPLFSELAKKLLSYKKKFMIEFSISDEKNLDDYPIFAREYKKNKKNVIPSYDKIYLICKRAIDSINISSLEVLLPGEKEVITDLNKYYSDVFMSNYRHYAIHTCLMTNGEANYLLGVNAANTFSAHYCDYKNDALQFSMFKKIERWGVLLFEDSINTKKKYSQCLECEIESAEDTVLQMRVRNNHGVDISILKTKGEK